MSHAMTDQAAFERWAATRAANRMRASGLASDDEDEDADLSDDEEDEFDDEDEDEDVEDVTDEDPDTEPR